MGQQADAAAAIAEYERRYQTIDPTGIAATHAVHGETDQALRWLERAYDEHDADLIFVKVNPHFNSLRDDRRFTAFLRKIHFAE